MTTNRLRRSLLHNLSSRLALVVAVVSATCHWVQVASAELVTFYFEGEVVEDQGASYPFALGQKISGSYTFELNTSPGKTPNDDDHEFTEYINAVTDFTVVLEGFGTGHATSGDIFLGNPVQTAGSYNFLSDFYDVNALMSGITIATSLGARNLLAAIIQMNDLDQVGLSSERLSATPPDVSLFLDHHRPNYDSDNAEIWLNFDLDGGPALNTASFRLTSLKVPEQNASPMAVTAMLSLVATVLSFKRRLPLSMGIGF